MTLGCGQLLRPRVTSVFGDMVRLMGNHEFFCCEKTDRRKAPFYKEVCPKAPQGKNCGTRECSKTSLQTNFNGRIVFSFNLCYNGTNERPLKKEESLYARYGRPVLALQATLSYRGGRG